MEKPVNYNQYKSLAENNRVLIEELTAKFAQGDESLTPEQVATVFYTQPFMGYNRLTDLENNAHHLYRIRDYRVAFYMYLKALEQAPCSLLLLKKAWNCHYFDYVDPNIAKKLKIRLKQVQDVVMASGDGNTAQTPFRVTHVSDEYQILYDIFHVKDVIEQKLVAKDGEEAIDQMTVAVLGEKEPRQVFFACYGETPDDMQDFFIRKKGF